MNMSGMFLIFEAFQAPRLQASLIWTRAQLKQASTANPLP